MRIIGSGGGGDDQPSQRTPQESPDSLHSKQYARIVDLVSEGEIEGLVDGLKSIYLDDTPIQATSGEYNFKGVSLDTRPGTQSQSYITGFPSVEAENSVSVEVKYGIPQVRSVTNTSLNAVRLTISVPTLSSSNPDNGDLTGTSVSISIDVNNNGGGYVTYVNDTIAGKTTSRYQRTYRIELPAGGPWDIRVNRLTADSTSTNLRNSTYWESYTEIVDSKLSYPNSAIIAVGIDAEQFRSIPKRAYRIKGMKVKIPSNYNPLTRVYTGIWDGTFITAWTDNPAWCFYDLIVNARYGLGAFIQESQVDKWSLYTISKYCDELVSDGFGGMEPRFTCNLYLQTREEAYKVINSMASIFRGMAYWAGGAIVPTQDAPAAPVALFTKANVINGEFNYQGSSARTRHTIALISWNDPEDRFKQKVEYVEDLEGIERYGIVQTEVLAVGCTSRGQAHRLGRWILYTERLESEVITFKTGLDGIVVNPGEIIKTTDPIRAGDRRGGRVVSATTTEVTIDAPTSIEFGYTYTLWAILPDGTVESRLVTTVIGSTTVLTVSSPFSDTPAVNSIWVLSSSNLTPETWRIVSISEVENSQAQITALAYREDKYGYVESNIALEPLQTSLANINAPDPISDINITESLYLVGLGVVGVKATVSWTPPARANSYIIEYFRANENGTIVTTNSSSIDLGPLSEGVYTFNITASNTLGKLSTTVSVNKEIFGKLLPPDDVSNFNLAVVNGTAYLTWDKSTDLDVIVNGYLRLRFTPDKASPTWNNSIDIGSTISSTSTSAIMPLLNGTYFAKWVDSTGNSSVNDVYITTDAADMLSMNAVLSVYEDPAFAGTYYKAEYDGSRVGIKISLGGKTIDQVLTYSDTWGFIDSINSWGLNTAGSYTFASYLDLGTVYTSRVTADIWVVAFNSADQWDANINNIDTWTSIDGNLIDDVDATLMIRTTNDDPYGTPTWSAWQPFFVGDWTARGFDFRLDMVSPTDPTHNILIKQLGITIDMPDRSEKGNDITSGTSLYSVVFTLPFKVAPNISITAQNMNTGDYYSLSSKTSTGFDITFRNSAGTIISKVFDWHARGY